MKEAKHPVQTTEKSLMIIESLKQNGGSRVTELAKELDIGKSVTHNHLSTLEEHGYVVRESNKYRLSLKFLDHGGHIRKQMDLYNTSVPEINKLAKESGELVNLLVEENGKGVFLYRAKGEKAVELDTYVGMRCHLHSSALGKAILATLSTDRVDYIIKRHGLPKTNDNTVTQKDELNEELKRTKERGFAIDDEERLEGLRCVAAPIKFSSQSVGAISISAPTARMSDDWENNEYVEQVSRVANVIELNKF